MGIISGQMISIMMDLMRLTFGQQDDDQINDLLQDINACRNSVLGKLQIEALGDVVKSYLVEEAYEMIPRSLYDFKRDFPEEFVKFDEPELPDICPWNFDDLIKEDPLELIKVLE